MLQTLAAVLGPDGTPAVAYTVLSADRTRSARYATKEGDAWRVETVSSDPPADSGRQALAIDPEGRPRVLFSISATYPRYQVLFASAVDGPWQSEPVVTGQMLVGRNTALVIDGAGAAHVMYLASDELGHATNASGAWVTESIGSGAGPADGTRAISTILDDGGALHVAYLDVNGVGDIARVRRVMYATDQSGEWQTQEVAFHARECALALDSAGLPHVLFVDDTDSEVFENIEMGPFEVRLASFDGESWDVEDLDGGDFFGIQSFVIDDDDTSHVAYSGETTEILADDGDGWRSDPLEPPAGQLVMDAHTVAAAFSEDRVLHVGWRSRPDRKDNDCDGTTW